MPHARFIRQHHVVRLGDHVDHDLAARAGNFRAHVMSVGLRAARVEVRDLAAVELDDRNPVVHVVGLS